MAEWGLEGFPIGYGLDEATAAEWGLFASGAIKDNEPPVFVEPALFLIRPDGELYASILQTMPFSRPPASVFLNSVKWIIQNGYPARGEHDLGS